MRYIEDGFISEEDIDLLLSIIRKGTGEGEADAGPTIFDPITGFLLQPNFKLSNVYEGDVDRGFTQEEKEVWKRTMDKIKRKVVEVHGLDFVHHTSPTFAASIQGDKENKFKVYGEIFTYFNCCYILECSGSFVLLSLPICEVSKYFSLPSACTNPNTQHAHDEYWHPHGKM